MATGNPHDSKPQADPLGESGENGEPAEAPHVGDLRHQGERLHDKASDLGQGTPGKPDPEGQTPEQNP